MILKDLIKQVEDHTGKPFDLENKRHFFHLDTKIKSLNRDRLRKLSLIEKAINSSNHEDEIFSSSEHFIQKRYRN